MKRILIAATFFFASFASSAQPNVLIGRFGHEYTKPKGAAVWDVRTSGDQLQLVTLNAEESNARSHELTEGERRKFWQSLWWPEETSVAARCVGNSEEVLCHVPPSVRSKINDLVRHRSNYFHFDPIGGLMEIQRASK